LAIQLDSAENSLGIGFAKFTTIQAKENCLNLEKQNKFVFPE
jgi:hypothetical protein